MGAQTKPCPSDTSIANISEGCFTSHIRPARTILAPQSKHRGCLVVCIYDAATRVCQISVHSGQRQPCPVRGELRGVCESLTSSLD